MVRKENKTRLCLTAEIDKNLKQKTTDKGADTSLDTLIFIGLFFVSFGDFAPNSAMRKVQLPGNVYSHRK